MEKYEQFKPDEETIENWLDGFEARLLCHGIQTCERKRNWCQALVGAAGRSIIKKLPRAATWAQVKQELCTVLGDPNPRERAIETLLQYKPKDKGLGEIAADIITQAARATEDEHMQVQLGLKAFLRAIPEHLGKELRRKHFGSVREALQEARFLQQVQETEKTQKGKVMAVSSEEKEYPDMQKIVGECLKQFKAEFQKEEKGSGRPVSKKSKKKKYRCWCCGKEGHYLMQCPTIKKNREAQQDEINQEPAENE